MCQKIQLRTTKTIKTWLEVRSLSEAFQHNWSLTCSSVWTPWESSQTRSKWPECHHPKKAAICSCRKIHLFHFRKIKLRYSLGMTNTATSIGLRLRLNTPANFKDTVAYSPQTHTSRHISPSSRSSPANLPGETISWWWPQMNGISRIHVFNKNNKQGCLSHKAPYGNWFITKAQHSTAVEAEAYRLLEVLFCQHFSCRRPHNDSTHSNSSQCRLGFRHRSMRCWKRFFFVLLLRILSASCYSLVIFTQIYLSWGNCCYSFPPLNPLCAHETFTSVDFEENIFRVCLLFCFFKEQIM